MNHQRYQVLSVILLLLSLLVELSEHQGWIVYKTQELAFGISLALVIASISFNVRIVRQMGIKKNLIRRSQLVLVISAIYALLTFGFELF